MASSSSSEVAPTTINTTERPTELELSPTDGSMSGSNHTSEVVPSHSLPTQSQPGRGRRLSQDGQTRTGLGMAPRRESDRMIDPMARPPENRFPTKQRLSASSTSSYGSIYKNALRQSFDNNSTTNPVVPRSSSSSNTEDLGQILSTFKFGSVGNHPDPFVLGTPTAELGPFEYPMNPELEKDEESYRRSSGSSSLLSDSEWRYTIGGGGVGQAQGAYPAGSGSGLGMPTRGLVEEAVATGPGIGRLRRMSTMNQVITIPEVRRPSVVHSNTDPLVDVVDEPKASGSASASGSQRDEVVDDEADKETTSMSLALHRRRATLEDGQGPSSQPTGLVLPPGSITSAALGTVNLINARRQSILSFGHGAPVETPVPPSLAGKHVPYTASPARLPTVGRREGSTSISSLRRGSLPVNNLQGTIEPGRQRQPSLGMTSVGPGRSAFARASFSTHAGPIVLNLGTRYEQTTVSTPYLYNRRNSLAHHYPLGAGSTTTTTPQVRPGLPPWQPRRTSTSEYSDAAGSVGGSSSTSSMQTIRGWRQGSDATSTPMGLGDDEAGARSITSSARGSVDEGLRRSMETFSFGSTVGTSPGRPVRTDSPVDREMASGPLSSYSFGRTSFSSSSASSSSSSRNSHQGGTNPSDLVRSRPGSISAIRSGFRSGRNSIVQSPISATSSEGFPGRTADVGGDTGREGRSMQDNDDDEDQGPFGPGKERTTMNVEAPIDQVGSGYDSQLICSSSSSASSTSSISSISSGSRGHGRGHAGGTGGIRPLDRFGRPRPSGRIGVGASSSSSSARIGAWGQAATNRVGRQGGCPVGEIPPFRGGPVGLENQGEVRHGAWTSGSSDPSTPSVEDDADDDDDDDNDKGNNIHRRRSRGLQTGRGIVDEDEDEDDEVDALTPMTEVENEVVLAPEVKVVLGHEPGQGPHPGLVVGDQVPSKETEGGLYVVYERD